MADLKSICGSLYRVKDQGNFIEQCVQDLENKSLQAAVLDQIQGKCGNVMPLEQARNCASQLGMNVAEPLPLPGIIPPAGGVQKPLGLLVDRATPRQQCEQKCTTDFMNEEISEKAWNECVDQCWLGAPLKEAVERSKKIEERHKEREASTPWGKFALKLGIDVSNRDTLFKGVFKEWNEGHPAESAAPSDDGVIDRGWRTGTRLALTTEPGFTRWPGTNVLLKAVLLDITLYNSESIELDKSSAVFEGNTNTYHGENSDVFLGDNTKLTLLDGEVQIPFFKRNFFELGFSLVKEDLLWWKNSNPAVFIPMNLHIGLNWQFQGTPITVNDHILDVTGMSYILSSYTMLGMRAQVASVNLYPTHKAAEFCRQVTNDCSSEDIQYEKSNGDFFPFGQGGYENLDSGLLPVPNDSRFQPSLTAHLFGEQRMDDWSTAYRLYTDFYPTWHKVEVGASLSLQIPLGEAMEFYIEGQARALQSTQDDNDILLPDSGYELSAGAGLGFKPSQAF